eukprot:6152259-Pleurochrysis_carterae.AAC.1
MRGGSQLQLDALVRGAAVLAQRRQPHAQRRARVTRHSQQLWRLRRERRHRGRRGGAANERPKSAEARAVARRDPERIVGARLQIADSKWRRLHRLPRLLVPRRPAPPTLTLCLPQPHHE